MIKKRDISIFIISLLLGFLGGFYFSRAQIDKNPKIQKVDTPINQITSNSLDYIANIKTAKGMIYLLINQDSIYFNPFETAINNSKNITIKKIDYPKLFEQGVANSSALQTEEYIDPQNKDVLIKLSNNQPDHGGYAKTYVLLVNPFTGSIKEAKNDYFKQ